MSLLRIVPLHFAPNRLREWFFELRFGELEWDFGIASKTPCVIDLSDSGVCLLRCRRNVLIALIMGALRSPTLAARSGQFSPSGADEVAAGTRGRKAGAPIAWTSITNLAEMTTAAPAAPIGPHGVTVPCVAH
jgi:hypothetical protein